jgi:uncharacterized protein
MLSTHNDSLSSSTNPTTVSTTSAVTISNPTTNQYNDSTTSSSSQPLYHQDPLDSSNTMLFNNSDAVLRTILTQTRTIAMVGASTNQNRDSYHVMEYLIKQCGYTVIPVNPTYIHQRILDQPVYGQLSDIYKEQPNIQIDMVQIFRRSSEVSDIVDEIIKWKVGVDPTTSTPSISEITSIWMQIGVIDHAAAIRATDHGFHVAMNVCPMEELPRLGIPIPIEPQR